MSTIETPAHVELLEENRVAVLSFQREHRLNPVNTDVLVGLHEGLTQAQAEPEARALVLTGRAESFTAGADVKHLASIGADEKAQYLKMEYELFGRIDDCPLATVAAISGVCFGNGLEMVLSCDLRVAASDVSFCYPEIRAGFAGPASRIVRFLGVGRATELLLSGRTVGAEEALELGLVTAVVEPAELRDAAVQRALTLAELPVAGVQETKRRISAAFKLAAGEH